MGTLVLILVPVVSLPPVELARVPAGPGLAAVVAALSADDAVFEAWAGTGGSPAESTGGGHVAATAELALALHRPHGTVTALVSDGHQLDRHPGLAWLVGEGHLSAAHARAVLAETRALTDDDLVRWPPCAKGLPNGYCWVAMRRHAGP